MFYDFHIGFQLCAHPDASMVDGAQVQECVHVQHSGKVPAAQHVSSEDYHQYSSKSMFLVKHAVHPDVPMVVHAQVPIPVPAQHSGKVPAAQHVCSKDDRPCPSQKCMLLLQLAVHQVVSMVVHAQVRTVAHVLDFGLALRVQHVCLVIHISIERWLLDGLKLLFSRLLLTRMPSWWYMQCGKHMCMSQWSKWITLSELYESFSL